MSRSIALVILSLICACADGPARDHVSVRLKVAGLAPAFTLSGEPDLAELRARTLALTPTAPPRSTEGIVFTVDNASGAAGLPDELRVVGGVVEMRTGASRAWFRDEHGLAEWLSVRALDAGAWSRVH